MRIMIDVDGVLADFCKSFTMLAYELGLTNRWWDTVGQEAWNFDFHVDPVWRSVDWRMNWWTTLSPIVGKDEIETVNNIIWEHDILFVTNRQSPQIGASVEEQTFFWLESIGIEVPSRRHVVATDNKAVVAQTQKIDIAIDDKIANLQALKEVGVTAVARGWKYNQEWEPRVNSISEFYQRYLNVRT